MKYFGTDGIRLKASEFTPNFLTMVVRGLVDYAGDTVKVLIGGDTRESTEWILADLAAILESFGLEYGSVGILPTPAIYSCFSQMGFDLAIDVTASHNPYEDNGIKIFEAVPLNSSNSSQSPASDELSQSSITSDSPQTVYPQKLSLAGCAAVEKSLAHGLDSAELPTVSSTLREDLHADALALYLDHLRELLGEADFSGLHIGMDCANGAMSVIGDQIFKEHGCEVELINADPSYGKNINRNCGSTHLESLQDLVRDHHLDFGVAFDGDGDRCLLVDETGAVVDGDQILALLAIFFNLSGFATTVMANQGLLNWAKDHQLNLAVTDVGDSNVLAAMLDQHLDLGGEQSGHIILPGQTTGDGMLTALIATKALVNLPTSALASDSATSANSAGSPTTSISPESSSTLGPSLSALIAPVANLPQVMVNFSATPDQKSAFLAGSAQKLLDEYTEKLNAISGRLLVRPSGTENLIRVTMWGSDADQIDQWTHELADQLAREL